MQKGGCGIWLSTFIDKIYGMYALARGQSVLAWIDCSFTRRRRSMCRVSSDEINGSSMQTLRIRLFQRFFLNYQQVGRTLCSRWIVRVCKPEEEKASLSSAKQFSPFVQFRARATDEGSYPGQWARFQNSRDTERDRRKPTMTDI